MLVWLSVDQCHLNTNATFIFPEYGMNAWDNNCIFHTYQVSSVYVTGLVDEMGCNSDYMAP